MTLDQISDFARRLSPLLHADAIVWLWCTNFHLLRHAEPVLDALGVSERAILTWVKDRFGYGHWLRSRTEQCVMAVRGQPTVTLKNESTVLVAPVDRHSAKPPEFYSMVERLCPAPRYLDVFSRYRHSEQWDCYGDKAPPMVPTPNETVVTPTTTEVLPTPATTTAVQVASTPGGLAPCTTSTSPRDLTLPSDGSIPGFLVAAAKAHADERTAAAAMTSNADGADADPAGED